MDSVTTVGSSWQEADRQAALDRYRILDTPREEAFDDIARIAAQICGAPTALITFIDRDRQWMKAAVGSEPFETARDDAFCSRAIQQTESLIVRDATRDARFADNPYVTGEPGIRFYAGAPLRTSDGFALGTLCVLDTAPRDLSEDQRRALEALARQVVSQLEMRRMLGEQRLTEERHRLILESATDYAIVSMDLNGLVTSWNEGARLAFGWTEDEMCGRPCDDFFTPEDRANKVPEREMGAALSSGRGTDERWHLRKDGTRFWASGEMMPLTDDADRPIGFLKILRDRTEQRRAQQEREEHRALLVGELQHRMKNTLAIVQAIVSQTLRNATSPADARDAIDGRLTVLGHAHDLLTQKSWTAAPIGAVVEGAIGLLGDMRHRVSASGPDVRCKARMALALSMALHELCTNATKYGALSNADGHVDIHWAIIGEDDPQFEFSWRESGGPLVVSPSRSGFGSRLMKSLSNDLGGDVAIAYESSGVRWTLRSAVDHVLDV